MVVGLMLGYSVFFGNVSGVYFGIITLAVAAILQQLFITLIKYTGGSNGLYGYPLPLKDDLVIYFFILVVALAAYLFCRWVAGSSFGRALEGIKQNDERMSALGYNVALLRLITFGLACGLAGLSGFLFTLVGFVSPELFGLLWSTSVIIWVAVGGRGTLIGAVVGTLLIKYLEELLSSALVTYWLLLVGVFLIAVVLFWPQGLMGAIKERFGRTLIG